jgi:hypothetical protein
MIHIVETLYNSACNMVFYCVVNASYLSLCPTCLKLRKHHNIATFTSSQGHVMVVKIIITSTLTLLACPSTTAHL